ncbi:hypothetical protein ACWC4D_33750 [Streptomyces sp. NPDC001288]
MPSDSRDEVTVVPAEVYDAMQASLDEPDNQNPALAAAAARAKGIVVKKDQGDLKAARSEEGESGESA